MTNDESCSPTPRRVSADLAQTRQRLREVETQDREPIAIVGMSLPLPRRRDHTGGVLAARPRRHRRRRGLPPTTGAGTSTP
ncbi:hypothetical protein LT493_05330 [Streptomyces tricolor]|nr:hypothetical protein [Streptomyces tricolor]